MTKELSRVAYAGKPPAVVKGYSLNREMSTGWNKVYENGSDVIMAVKGTNMFDVRDIMTDAVGMIGSEPLLRLTGNKRFAASEKLAIDLKRYAKDSGKRFVITGHSLGGYIASHLSQYADKVVTHNRMTSVPEAFTYPPTNNVDYSSLHDYLTPFNYVRPRTRSQALKLNSNRNTLVGGVLTGQPFAFHSLPES